MKKLKVLTVVVMAILMMVAISCSSETTVEEELPAAEVIVQEEVSEESASEPQQDTATETIELSSTQLINGSFLLQDAGLEITAEQASQLAPMWKVYQSMLNSDTAAETEREALVNQIAGLFTTEQQEFLASADTGQESVQAIMSNLGIEMQGMGGGQRGDNGEGEEGERAERPEGGEGDVVGGRDGGGGQGGEMAGQEIDEEQQATMQAERAANGGGAQAGGQMDSMLLPYLIEMLEAIV